MYLDEYAAAHNPHFLGRGEVHFSAPLLPSGSVNMAGYGARWGTNWPANGVPSSGLRLPPGRPVGNARSLALQPAVRRLATSAWDTRPNLVVDAVEATVQLYGHGAANLADALHATRTQASSQTTTDTIHTGRANLEAGCTLFTRHLVDTLQPVTVTPSWTTWAEGHDWERGAFGVRLLHGLAGPVGSSVSIGYHPEGSAQELDAMRLAGLELGVTWIGRNAVDGRPMRVELFRAQPVLDGALQPLGESAGAINIKFNLLPVRGAASQPTSWYRVTRGSYASTH
ncbi:hypothetical protein [Paracidovorax wautersii]|uniref:hypothetical protein n=1 Tax=Paracidovorax wautersii TaxID=1177982 RepID=UPI0031DF2D79